MSQMAREIGDQPRTWGRVVDTVTAFAATPDGRRFWSRLRSAKRVTLVGSGSSYHAARYGALSLGLAGVHADATFASTAFRTRGATMDREVVVGVSHSGTSSDILSAVERARRRGARILGMSNVVDTPLLRTGDSGLATGAGPELAIPSTKGFTAFLLAFDLIAHLIHADKDVASKIPLVREIRRLAKRGEALTGTLRASASAVRNLSGCRAAVVLGDGRDLPVALDGALKLVECAYLPAMAHAFGEFLHGPLALVDRDIAIIALSPANPWLKDARVANAVAESNGMVSAGSAGSSRVIDSTEHIIFPDWVRQSRPYLHAVFVQWLAHDIAQALGHPIDTPRRLTKTVLHGVSAP